MKHIILSSNWQYSEEPFPAYRIDLVYGRNKKDFKMLPVKDIVPIENEDNQFILPDNQFKIIKTKAKGTILAVPGNDTTNRCLLMTCEFGGFRGDVDVIEKDTDANILLKCWAGNACDSACGVAAVLDTGQQVVVHSYGRRTNKYVVYGWDGNKVNKVVYQKDEYNALKDDIDDCEEI